MTTDSVEPNSMHLCGGNIASMAWGARDLISTHRRQVYNAPDGKKVLASGTPSGQFVEMC